MRRLVLIPLRVATAILAFTGLMWIVAARPTVELVCSNRVTLVHYHAILAEKRGNWLDAAHNYAHLLEYDDDSEDGCRSSELNDGAWLIPFGALLLTAAPEPSQKTKDALRAYFQSKYERAMRNAERSAATSRGSAPAGDPAGREGPPREARAN